MRQAAILLASLHPRDRAWIGRRLPDRWWAGLKQLSKHIRNLGPVDAGLLRDALHAAQDARPEPPTPDVLLAGLEGLAPVWVARTLAACAPDHREMYLTGRSPADQAAIEHALREAPSSLPPELAATLARLVRQRGERALLPQVRA
jgi:hypothetical protein